MATNLFEAFDSAFAGPRRSRTAELLADARSMLGELLRRRRRSREMRRVMEMPPHLLKDIGLAMQGGKLGPITDAKVDRTH